MVKEEKKTVGARVTKAVYDAIENIVREEGLYFYNTSDYLRDLIREDFKKRGIKIEESI